MNSSAIKELNILIDDILTVTENHKYVNSLADVRNKIKELEKVTEDYVELPKDSEGKHFKFGCHYRNGKGEVCVFGHHVYLLNGKHEWSLDGWIPENCTIVTPPYDKNYRTIEAGRYVAIDMPGIDRLRKVELVDSALGINLEPDEDKNNYRNHILWARENAHKFEICDYGFEPDTQEKIDTDVLKSAPKYWKCVGFLCTKCPSKIIEEQPYKHYQCGNCVEAKIHDLLRRQRAIDEVEA